MFLDPDFFDNDNKLHSSVCQDLLDIANDILANLTDKAPFTPSFIVLTGSLTGPSWDKASDIDLHIGVDFSELPEGEVDLYKALLTYYALNFNGKGYTANGRKIELYFQDTAEKHEAPGIYDLVNDEWVKTPEDIKHDVDGKIEDAARSYLSNIGSLVFEWEETQRNKASIKAFLTKLNDYFKQVTEMRKQSLLNDGMYGFGNLVFKELRRNGALQQLSDLRRDVQNAYYEVYEGVKMNKAIKILNLTEAFMASGFVKAIYTANQNLGSLWKSLDASINTVADMLQEPVDEKNVNKVDRALRGLEQRLDNFEKAVHDVQFKLSELREEIIRYARKEAGTDQE